MKKNRIMACVESDSLICFCLVCGFVCAIGVGPSIWSQIDMISYEGLIHESVVFIFGC
jgi:hypothetical protein